MRTSTKKISLSAEDWKIAKINEYKPDWKPTNMLSCEWQLPRMCVTVSWGETNKISDGEFGIKRAFNEFQNRTKQWIFGQKNAVFFVAFHFFWSKNGPQNGLKNAISRARQVITRKLNIRAYGWFPSLYFRLLKIFFHPIIFWEILEISIFDPQKMAENRKSKPAALFWA